MLEKDREEPPQCLFLILLVWREGGALVSFERFYSCLFGPLEGAVCGAGCAKALSVPLLLLKMGPSPGRPGAGLVQAWCGGRQLPWELCTEGRLAASS